MKTQATNVNVKNLCSRKLLELCATAAVNPADLSAIVEELQERRHYLDKLSNLHHLQPSRALGQRH